jgi:hypothetical protein
MHKQENGGVGIATTCTGMRSRYMWDPGSTPGGELNLLIVDLFPFWNGFLAALPQADSQGSQITSDTPGLR